jgi:predicted transcriptional regulator YheO
MDAENTVVFDQAIRTADILVEMLGSRCEVAVHDFSNLDQSLIYLAGTLTDRKIGSPITNLVLKELKKDPHEINDIPNYKTVSKKGLVMKSSTVFLKNDEGEVIGAMCINIDISLMMQVAKELSDFIGFEETQGTRESFYSSVNEVIEDMVNSVIEGFNKPSNLLDMDEKIECVRILEEKGTFLIKGSTDYVASVLGVSKFTIYNYLQKIRTQLGRKEA